MYAYIKYSSSLALGEFTFDTSVGAWQVEFDFSKQWSLIKSDAFCSATTIDLGT